jgi:hypothetical protein
VRRSVPIEFDEFGLKLLNDEAARQGVSVSALVRHAVMYYLADRDSGRVATHVLPEVAPDPEVAPVAATKRRAFS